MTRKRLILAIGRVERALSRMEQIDTSAKGDLDLMVRHDRLKSETRLAIQEIDTLIAKGAN